MRRRNVQVAAFRPSSRLKLDDPHTPSVIIQPCPGATVAHEAEGASTDLAAAAISVLRSIWSQLRHSLSACTNGQASCPTVGRYRPFSDVGSAPSPSKAAKRTWLIYREFRWRPQNYRPLQRHLGRTVRQPENRVEGVTVLVRVVRSLKDTRYSKRLIY
jgi:hypothetical protein